MPRQNYMACHGTTWHGIENFGPDFQQSEYSKKHEYCVVGPTNIARLSTIPFIQLRPCKIPRESFCNPTCTILPETSSFFFLLFFYSNAQAPPAAFGIATRF